jgi:hypothetical protein
MKVFVPFNDAMMDDPGFAELLVPYQPGLQTLNQVPDLKSADQSRANVMTSPGTRPSSDAVPALSSNTYIAGPSLG